MCARSYTYFHLRKSLLKQGTCCIHCRPDLEIVSESDGESDSAKGTKSPSTNKDILRLDLAEAFFLSHALGCLVVEEGNEKKELSLDDMFETYSKSKTNAEGKNAVI